MTNRIQIRTVKQAIEVIKTLQKIAMRQKEEITHLKKVTSTGRSNPDDFINMFKDIAYDK